MQLVCVWTLLSKKFLIQKCWIYKSLIYSVIPFHCCWLFYRSLLKKKYSFLFAIGTCCCAWHFKMNPQSFFLQNSEAIMSRFSELAYPSKVRVWFRGSLFWLWGLWLFTCSPYPQCCALLVSYWWESHLHIRCWTVLAVKGPRLLWGMPNAHSTSLPSFFFYCAFQGFPGLCHRTGFKPHDFLSQIHRILNNGYSFLHRLSHILLCCCF